MKPERWKQVDELFDAVLEIPADSREKFLKDSCDVDEELRDEVLSLLKAHDKADGFMALPAMEVAAKNIAQENTDVEKVGSEIGGYKIEKLLGTGGMGEVYLAHDTKLNRKVALKILPPQFVKDTERIKRFEREARAVSSLNHPNLITIYDIGNSDGVNFIATEFVEGKTVRELIEKKVSMKDALAIAMQVAEALGAAHNEKIVHRDIKPENIMIRPDGYVKVLDFGLAKLMEPTSEEMIASFSNTQPGIILGTLAYMSPEQSTGEDVDHRTDIWSLGVVLYEMVTGITPFKGTNRKETLDAILSKEPQSVTVSNPSLHLELERIIGKALEKDRDFRYQTATDLRADLKRLKRDIDSSPSFSSRDGSENRNTIQSKPPSLFHNHKFIIAVTAFTTLVLAFGLWMFISRWNKTSVPKGYNWSLAANKQLTDLKGYEFNPSLSPDGKSFIYMKDDGGDYDIFLQRVGGKTVTNLTANSIENDRVPVFSPDGNFIVFRSERKPSGIYVMEATGENPRFITAEGFPSSWSPDGKEIVISELGLIRHTEHKSRDSALWIVNVETHEKRLLTKGDAVQPSWSPNGHRIAYWFITKGRRGDIATIPAEGGEPLIITTNEATDWNPVWSPDGKFIYFSSDRGGSMNLWRVAVDEKTGKTLGEPEAIVTPSKYSYNISFSRDGKTMIYVRYESISNIKAVSFDPTNGKVIGEPFWVTTGSQQVGEINLSPDGEQYAVNLSNNTQEDLAIVNKDGSNWRLLTQDWFNDKMPYWSPDNKQIAFQSDRSGNLQIWTINADGTGLKQISFADENGAYLPVWSPDGRQMIINKINEQGIMPIIVDLSRSWHDQIPKLLTPVKDFQGTFTAMDWSPDGDKIIGMLLDKNEKGAGTAVFSFSKNSYEKVNDLSGTASWLEDNRRFILSLNNKLYIGDIQTKKVVEIFSPASNIIQYAQISADNKIIYFRFLQAESDIWMMNLE